MDKERLGTCALAGKFSEPVWRKSLSLTNRWSIPFHVLGMSKMKKSRLALLIVQLPLVALALVLSSCATKLGPESKYSVHFDPPLTPPSNPANVKIKLSRKAQRVYLVEGDKVLLATPCSVGRAGTPTPAGTFRIAGKTQNRRRVSQPGAGYPMTYWMQFYSPAYGMHWGFVKPYPCTHGCVRLPVKSARKIFETVRVGTPIIIADSHPEDETIGKTLPVLDDGPMPDPPWSYMTSAQVFKDAAQGKFYTY